MRVRFGFDFDEAGRASGFNSVEHGALSVSANPINGLVAAIASDQTFHGFAVASVFGGAANGLAAPEGHITLAPANVDTAETSTDLLVADSLTGTTNTPTGGHAHAGASHSGQGGDGVNGASGAGLTARISQYFDAGQSRYEFSGNQDIDAVLIGSKWTITSLTYSFPTSGSFYGAAASYYDPTMVSNHVTFNAAQKTATRYALGLIASYTGLTFTEVTETNSTHGNLRFSQASAGITSAEGNFPGSDSWDGDIWFNSGASSPQPYYQTPQIGNWGQATIMHEIGHTMGLKHGHQDYTADDLVGPGYIDGPGVRHGSAALDQNHNGQDWTLMTYITDPTDNPHHFGGEGFNQPQTYMQNDIAALQYLYGANFNFNSGNTTYTFSSTTGQMFVNGVGQGLPTSNKISRTIWDGNGTDTYDLSNYTTGLNIDLNPGAFSTFSTAQLVNHQAASGGTAIAEGNIANALLYGGDLRSLIENATGGSGDDEIRGNQANNVLRGNDGDDYLYAREGNDTAYGGAGNDTLNETVADGNDIQYGEGGNDVVYGGGGQDWVDGGDGNDTLYGNTGDDWMYGAAGNDDMTGGDGDDTYYVDSILDTVTESPGGGTDLVVASITYVLGANVENLNLSGAGNINGTGNSLNNIINGNSGANLLLTGGGIDTVDGNGGNDTIYSSGYGSYLGDGGDDYIYAGNGSTETLDGGGNTDTLNTTSYSGSYTINLVTGATNFGFESFVNFENLITGAGNDSITGTTGNNIIDSGAGNDTVRGNGFAGGNGDIVDGGDGNDLLYSSGRGVYAGGLGNDTIFAATGSPETLDGGAGTDLLDTTSWTLGYVINLVTGVTNYATESFINFENVTTGNGSDTITGTSGVNIINTGLGNDTIDSGAGDDTVNSGDGNDRIFTTSVGTKTYNAGVGNDTVGGGFFYGSTWDGGAGIDTLDMTWVFEGIPNPTVNLGTGVYQTDNGTITVLNFENYIGFGGGENITGSVADNVINAGAGNDTVNSLGGTDTVNGEDGDDLIWSTSFSGNTYNGGAGNDTVGGGFQYGNTWNGGADIDTLDMTFHNFTATTNLAAGTYTTVNGTLNVLNFENFNAGNQNDTITGTSGANTINGNGGNDTINAGDGVDSVYGGEGDDLLDGGLSYGDYLDGGLGSDTVDYSWIGQGFESENMVIDLTLGSWVSDLGSETLVSIEGVLGSQSGETIIGNSDANGIDGNGGNDTISGGDGNDTLNGGTGDDSIDAGAPGTGTDTVDAGDGNDWIHSSGNGTYQAGLGNDTVVAEGTSFGNIEVLDGGDGIDFLDLTAYDLQYVFNMATGQTNYSGDYGESFINFENVTTGANSDNIVGNDAANTINVGAGDDVVIAGLGDDTVNGGDGNDNINGLDGADTITGGNGNDTLSGGYTGSAAFDTVDGGDGNDAIFSSGTGSYTGGLGNDTMWAENTFGTGETLDGGAGVDTLDISIGSFVYVIDLSTGVTNYSVESFVNFENVISGGADDAITGTAGANSIWGGSGNDTVNAGAGNDYIDGGLGADSLSGQAGNDTYIVEDSGDLVVEAGGSGTDQVNAYINYTLTGNVENLVLAEGAGDLTGTGNTAANRITGNSGNNAINGRAGADSMYGNEGSDTYYVDDLGDRAYEDNVAGVDLVISAVSYSGAGQYIENITLTGTANNFVTGNGIVNTLTGNSGDNTLNGAGGADTMIGGAGNDTYTVENAGDVVIEANGGGADVVNASVSYALGAGVYVEVLNLTGGASINATGNALANTINGNSGNNWIDGLNGADTMAGGVGDDTYVVDNPGDLVTENVGEGNDWIASYQSRTLGANIENLQLLGAAGLTGTGNADNNSIFGNSGNNKLFGLDGNDYLDGLSGNDTLTGGLGDDTYTIDVLTDVIVEAVGEGSGDYVRSAINYTLGANLEILELLGAAANATGNALDNTLWGNTGNNLLDGLAGADLMTGDAGDDTFVVDNAGDAVVEANGGGADVVNASVSYTLGVGVYVETFNLTGGANINATGNALANTLNGNSGNNTLNGAVGADSMTGGLGDDTYFVDNAGDRFFELIGEGNDWVFSTVSVGVSGQYVENIELQGVGNINANGQGLDNMILGNGGANTLNGGSGNDTLSGRGGNDILIGGTGADKFIFIAGSGLDTINDFNAAQNDLININDYTHGVVNDPSVTITQVGGDVTIDLGGGNIITVIGATAAAPAFQSHIVW